MDNKTKEQGQMLDCHADASNDEKVHHILSLSGGSQSDLTHSKTHHILSLSGGKDSTALAFFMKENNPEIFEQMELVFCDTECELPEIYEYLNKIEVFLNKKITRLKPERSFDHLMAIYKYFPSPIKRWCTVELKAKPFEKYISNFLKQNSGNIIKLYIGIRADELRRAKYNKYNNIRIQEIYPFVDNFLNHNDIMEVLNKSGIGLPDYYKWATRSGCYFCPYQSKLTWLNLQKHHPDLFYKAKKYEDIKNLANKQNFKKVGFNLDMTLEEMILPENKKQIIEDFERKSYLKPKQKISNRLTDLF
ncbi:MAG: phosphoadenosine phosphosulfate reductase family protein [Candidatus Gastranaerophilales bacterium]